MARITGARSFMKRLDRLGGPEKDKALLAALFSVGEAVKVEAQISITTGATSAKGQHRPSAPGTPPNNDSGVLANNIISQITGPLRVEVSSNAPYAAIQEYGGTINHPGGTAYFIGENGLAVFVPDSNIASTYLPRTKPHVITLPERPYMRPASQRVRKSNKSAVKKLRDVLKVTVAGRAL